LVEVRNAGGTLTTFASPGHNPYGLAFDKSGNLYVALAGNGNIVKYDSNTNQTLVAALGSSAQPVGLAFDPAGNLYVSEYANNSIVKIDPQYNVTVFATNGLNGPLFLAIEAAAPELTITNSGNQAIVSWPPSVTGWTLQTNNNLVTGSWGNYLGPVVNNATTNAPPKGNLFFRLKQ
jgi:DNA-binding beta-propeller fold protein YncE